MTPRTRLWLCRGLVALGLSRGLLMLAGLPMAQFALIQLVASPLPLVFDSPLYFSDFTLILRDADGAEQIVALGPEHVARLQGPMGRTQVLTQAMAWAPHLPEDLREDLHCALFSSPGDFITELGGRPGAAEVEVEIRYEGLAVLGRTLPSAARRSQRLEASRLDYRFQHALSSLDHQTQSLASPPRSELSRGLPGEPSVLRVASRCVPR